MKSQALRLGHRTPQPCQWLDWVADSSFLAAYKHKFISVFGESSVSPAQPSLAYCLVMSTLSRQHGLGCPWAKDPSVCHLGCCKSVNSIWDKVDSVQMSLTKIVQQSASSWHPCLLIHLWFPSCPLLLVWDFCDNHRETILPKTHSKETHCYDWPDLYGCCVYDDQFWDKDSGTSWVRGGGGGDQCATLHGLGGMESDRPRQQGAPSTSRSAGKSAQGLIWGHEQGMWNSMKL